MAWATPIGMKARTPPTGSSCSGIPRSGAVNPSTAADPSEPQALDHGPKLGLEMEMVTAHAQTGASQPVDGYFAALLRIKQKRGIACAGQRIGSRDIGLQTPTADCGLDNGYNLLETALAPVRGGQGGLNRLAAQAFQELADSLEALKADQAVILNASQHPWCSRDAAWYRSVCVPRPIYRELREYRGWHHWEGIDAKAQNGANTSVPVSQAVRALNVAVALAPASIALFANSPLESGAHGDHKEHRMTLWPRVFGPARFAGDLRLCSYPERPFAGLGDFFSWMFGPGTVTRGLPLDHSYDYKSVPVVLLDGDPCLQQFLRSERWPGRRLDTGQATWLTPQARHVEYSQIGQFLDARLRYRLERLPPLEELLRAWQSDGGLESLFEACGAQMYIEARAPGAGYADACLLQEGGPDAARSLLLAPSALQLGLLNNLDEACSLVQDWGWKALGELREPSMQAGLGDEKVRALCAQVLAVARGGLDKDDAPWLAYADFALDSGRTSADRMLDTWNSARGAPQERLPALLPRHAALHPDRYGAMP